MAFIEFGEQGSYLTTSQLSAAYSLVRYTKQPLVVTYVHGWHNDSGSKDVARFSCFLRDVARSELVRREGFSVVGVYLGWRGELTKVPGLNEFTFYGRKAAAERLVNNFDCFDAISSMAEAARGHHARGSRYTVLIGHSFGGLVVERAVAHALDAKMHGRGAKGAEMPADLTLVWNPASDSILSRQIIAALSQWKTANTRPLFVSVTSTADAATGTIFPIATTISSLSKTFSKVADPGTTTLESERRYYTSTPGHKPELINHKAELRQADTTSLHGESATSINLSNQLHNDDVALPNDSGGIDLWELRQEGPVNVPYWNIQVDRTIIKNHGDVWNAKAEALIAGLFRIANPLKPAKGRPEPNFGERNFKRGAYKQDNTAPTPPPL